MSSRIRMLEDDDTESQQDNNLNLLNPRSNSGQKQQEERMVSMTREELQVLLTRTVDRRIGELLKQTIVPMMSMIVKEEIEKVQEKYFASFRQNSPSGSSSAEPRSLQLQFVNNPSLPIFSGFLIKAEGQTPLEVAIVDYSTKQVVKSGPESSLKVEIIAVEGHFDGNGSCSWSLEGLSSYIVKQKDGTKSLLKGKVHLALKEGIGFVGDIFFRHDQNWIRKCELKLVAIAMDKLHGITVKGAMTELFEVKDKRITYNSKCGPPRLGDPVGRLQNIGKALSGCLILEKIETVKDFLTQLSLYPQRLREILRNMSPEKWDTTVKHARTCELGSGISLHTRISPNQKKIGVVFNVVAEVVGLYSESIFKSSDNLSEKEKAEAQKMVVAAYEHREELKYFDQITLLHAYWESVNATSASGSPITPGPLVPYIEAASTLSYDVPGTSSYYSAEGSISHFTSPPVHGSSHLTDVTDYITLEHLEDDTSQLMFSDEYAQSNFSFTRNIGSESENDNIPSGGQDLSLPVFSPPHDDFLVNELLGFGDVNVYQNSDEDMQRFLACAAAQKRWMMVFGALKWFSRRKTAGVSNVVSSEGIQAPKRSRIY